MAGVDPGFERLIELLMARLEEVIRDQIVGDAEIAVVVEQNSTEESLFRFDAVRRFGVIILDFGWLLVYILACFEIPFAAPPAKRCGVFFAAGERICCSGSAGAPSSLLRRGRRRHHRLLVLPTEPGCRFVVPADQAEFVGVPHGDDLDVAELNQISHCCGVRGEIGQEPHR